jgi:hypothetical protein
MYEDKNNIIDRSLYFLRNNIPRVNARKQVLWWITVSSSSDEFMEPESDTTKVKCLALWEVKIWLNARIVNHFNPGADRNNI